MGLRIRGVHAERCGIGIFNAGGDIEVGNLTAIDCEIAAMESSDPVDIGSIIRQRIHPGDREELLALVDTLSSAKTKESAASTYERFLAIAANHMTILGPYLPSIARFFERLPG